MSERAENNLTPPDAPPAVLTGAVRRPPRSRGVPLHYARGLPARSPSRRQVALIIPAHNEEQSIEKVLKAIPRHLAGLVIVVDNASTDRTAWIARKGGAQVVPQPERGYGAACLAGIAALPRETEVVVFLDADYSDYPEDLGRLLAPILEGRADLVIGTRTKGRASRAALTPQQRWGNRLATALIRWRFGFAYTDLGPFRAVRRDALERIGMTDRDFGWTVEMQIKAVRQGLRVTEVPVRYRVRIGRSKISGTVKGTLLAGLKIIYTICKHSLARRCVA